MHFLADESCDFSVVRALRSAGHDVHAVAELAFGSDDIVVMDLAVREARILLTEDKDFGQLVYAYSRQSSGVISIRYPANARKTFFLAAPARKTWLILEFKRPTRTFRLFLLSERDGQGCP